MSDILACCIIFGTILLAIEVARHRERQDINMERKAWRLEREDLYNRIQSESLSEYKEFIQPPPDYTPISKDDEDLYELEIEENKR